MKRMKKYIGQDKSGFIYVMSCDKYGWQKIGFSKNVDNRYKAISSTIPFEVDCIFEAYHDKAERLEYMIHLHFDSKHISNEWFEFGCDMDSILTHIEVVKRICKFYVDNRIAEFDRGLFTHYCKKHWYGKSNDLLSNYRINS